MRIHELDDEEMDYDDEDEDTRSYLPNPFKILWQSLLSIKKIISIGCTLLLLALISLILVLIFRPDPLWNPLKSFINDNYSPEQASQEYSYNAGEEIIVSEQDLAYLIQKNLNTDKAIATELEPGKISIFLNIDSNEKPLWVKTVFEVSESGYVELKEIGLVRFNLPQLITSKLDSLLGRLLDVFNSEDIDNVLEQLFAEEFRIFNVRIEENQIILQSEVK
ncbi:hypothetical protein KC909_01975 [Candidatus Dojkabacteria bacterium]|uniref:Uncharacterized protein n=1 Tax=Candidatus Dojkabacteria bacterium TaxID=2099670 RepID=A0A955L4W1_9BACT|nr:hypothetical protein [Candidatus Dojkabacteria bacterium]